MIALAVVFVLVLLFIVARRRRRVTKRLAAPIAGINTGYTSAWRVPGRFSKPHRGF